MTLALRSVRHLQSLVINFRDLLLSRATLDKTPTATNRTSTSSPASEYGFPDGTTFSPSFRPIPRRLRARPSVDCQLRRRSQVQASQDSQNFYSCLTPEDPNEVPEGQCLKESFKMATAPTTFHKHSLDDLIKEFTTKDLPKEHFQQPEADVGRSFRIRLALRMGNFHDHASPCDKIEAAFRLLKSQDESLCILPF